MAYLPPNLRKPKTKTEIEAEILAGSDNHFPSLGNSVVTSKQSTLSYADKAREWKERKEEIEMNERIQAELKIQREEREKRQQEEDDYMRSRMPLPPPKKEVAQHVYTEAPKIQSEWTRVEPKPRRERKEINFEEDYVPDELEAEDPSTIDRHSKNSKKKAPN